jgi:hypothetical protein
MRINRRIGKILILPVLFLLLAFIRLGDWNSVSQWMRPASTDSVQPVAASEPDWSQGRLLVANPEGENVYAWGAFRIIYHTQGEHAVPETDRNQNGIPDYVEDAALQLVVARHIFLNLCGFPDPLHSSRNAGVKFVDVYVYNFPKHRKYTGIAKLGPYPAHAPAPPGVLALRIVLSRNIVFSSKSTMPHEYFHLIQHGATHLANKWYLEGMAIWAQYALDKDAQEVTSDDWKKIDRLLYTPGGMEELFASSYLGNRILWTPLAELCDQEGGILPEDDPLLQSVYSNGLPVLKDFRFRGAKIMREVLRRFAAIEHIPYELYHYSNWKRQRMDPRNNTHMLEEVRAVVREMCPARGTSP